MRAEVEARVWEEHNHRNWEEAERIMQEKMTKVARQDERVGEKLMELLAGWITQEVFQEDLEAEEIVEVEESEAMGTEDFGMTSGTQLSAIEVNEEEEDEVVVVEEVK